MTKMLKITLNDETFLADMLWDEAPETCKLFEASCPVESRIFSAKVCDTEVTYPVSFLTSSWLLIPSVPVPKDQSVRESSRWM